MIRIIDETWRVPKIGRDLVYGICDHFRRSGHFDAVVQSILINKVKCSISLFNNNWSTKFAQIPTLRTRMCELLDAYMSVANRDYLVQLGYAKEFVKSIIKYGCDEREHRRQIALSLLDPFLKHGTDICRNMADWGCLDLLLRTCKYPLTYLLMAH